MKEAFGNTAITTIVITFMAILILILASSSSYSKASKVRNRIIEMIENNQGYGSDCKACVNPWDTFRDDVEKELDYNELVNALNNFLSKLSQGKRKIFLERYWYLYSIKEISSKNKITESNTKTILLRLRNQLRNYLKEGGLYE